MNWLYVGWKVVNPSLTLRFKFFFQKRRVLIDNNLKVIHNLKSNAGSKWGVKDLYGVPRPAQKG